MNPDDRQFWSLTKRWYAAIKPASTAWSQLTEAARLEYRRAFERTWATV